MTGKLLPGATVPTWSTGVIPMLPFRLSNGICSLNEGVDRLVLSCDMEITPEGERVSYDIYPAVMRSHGRLTYNKVNQALRADVPDSDLEDKYVKVRPMLKDMAALHEVLYKQRHARGVHRLLKNRKPRSSWMRRASRGHRPAQPGDGRKDDRILHAFGQ